MRAVLCFVIIGALLCYAYGFEGNMEESHSSHEKSTNHWAVEVAAGVNPDELAAAHGFINLGPVGSLRDVYLFHKNLHTRAMVEEHQPALHKSPHVKWLENQVSKKRFKRFGAPSDPLFNNQWHLKNTNAGGVDINIASAWERGYGGDGVTIAMVDDGLQRRHPDISPNYLPEGSYDFNDNDQYPDPHPDNGDNHGTSAGGVAAAKNNNNVCGSGVAPDARLSGIRLIAQYTTDAQEAAGLSFRYDVNHIYSNSWGPNDDGRRLERPGRLTLRAMEDAVNRGRSGKGSVYVWAGGNGRAAGDNCNYDGYANSRFTIAIGAVDYMGKQAYYSENCAALVACAPSSGSSKAIITTDLLGSEGTTNSDCTSNFGGTSAAAPLVAGVVALVLQANPNLGWRDVQQVLINSSRITDAGDSDWFTNSAGYTHNHKYGFGLVDASAAVNTAIGYENLPPLKVFNSSVKVVGSPIPDVAAVESVINVPDRLSAETVEVVFTASHSARGQLYITLKSPTGTISVLHEPHSDRNSNFDDWTFTTVRSWGEMSNGDWTLHVEDKVTGNVGIWISWAINVYGH